MELLIRQENPGDLNAVFELTEAAFREMPFSDKTEQFLVERLRKSDAFIPRLSIVAVLDGRLVGHILLTRATVDDGTVAHVTLALGPVSVLPEFQRKGIGSALMIESHRIAVELGFRSVVLVGHPGYYPRFGYRQMKEFGMKVPFEAPEEACMAVELVSGGLENVHGTVQFAKEFF